MHDLLLDTAFTISTGALLLVLILAVDYLYRGRQRRRSRKYIPRG